jgi:hypothetical protein
MKANKIIFLTSFQNIINEILRKLKNKNYLIFSYSICDFDKNSKNGQKSSFLIIFLRFYLSEVAQYDQN